MPIVNVRPVSSVDHQQREYARLRYGRVAPATIREIQKRQGPPRSARATPPAPTFLERIYGRRPPARLTAPGPAFLPHLLALEQLEERRAAAPRASAASSSVTARPTPAAAPAESQADWPPRGLLGW